MIKFYLIKFIKIVLFFSICLATNAQAAEKPAGKILRLKGDVEVVRHGEIIEGKADLEIYPLDEIKTGLESMLELILRDGSSLHMGPDSHLELSRYNFNLTGDKPSFIAKMAKGLFVYISGAISKVHPGAVKFETPNSSIGIRGTKLVVKILESGIESVSRPETQPGDKGDTIVILFRDNTGKVGTVTISNQHGMQTLNKEFYSVRVKLGSAPSELTFLDKKTLEQMLPESLYPVIFENYSPPLPYTAGLTLLEEFGGLFTQPLKVPDPVPVSASSP